jgi:hypothetical protein
MKAEKFRRIAACLEKLSFQKFMFAFNPVAKINLRKEN